MSKKHLIKKEVITKIGQLGKNYNVKDLQTNAQRIVNESDDTKTNINIMGCFSSGKTTMINSLIPHFIENPENKINFKDYKKNIINIKDSRLFPLSNKKKYDLPLFIKRSRKSEMDIFRVRLPLLRLNKKF